MDIEGMSRWDLQTAHSNLKLSPFSEPIHNNANPIAKPLPLPFTLVSLASVLVIYYIQRWGSGQWDYPLPNDYLIYSRLQIMQQVLDPGSYVCWEGLGLYY